MENFRLFLIRLLQVSWVLVILSIIATIIVEHTFMYFWGVGVFIGIPLVIIQYLVFAKLNPAELFDGRIKENLTT